MSFTIKRNGQVIKTVNRENKLIDTTTHPDDDYLIADRGGRTIVPFREMKAVK
ncbi:hypothetical protein SNF32_06985 [Enterococcus mundtii]|uniref:hypothetical protein n=1 Tax=Enterococcus TaxID=1350 RepID=UPI0012FD00A3|nr:hypothetical protein [Enterococcus mundtii]MDY4307195.1 hypothetical protein [Enterococcus mundtii]